ncbi:pirin family protein [Specibacter cremeus]|uniref:pirin family protein n=1 Tax=Specibacter cremeus TaxID=1629051 RepID=UPI000F7892CC|nr:pirin family protein [Specibacter cremeus]
MSNLESNAPELLCPSSPGTVEVLSPRLVPLGGPRAMTVRRTLPQRQRSLIGAWCFVDHYGPDDVASSGGMVVPPHPHTGLQTVSWLFTGEVDHADSAGYRARVRPGELNLMTAGRGISHSEYSTPETTVLHGAQLWVALPSSDRFTDPGFESYRPPALPLDGGTVRVFLGSLAGSTSPVRTFTPLLGAELLLDPGAVVALAVDPAFEHGLLVDAGAVTVNGHAVDSAQLGYAGPGHDVLAVAAGDEPARLLLLGGTPLGESIVMWWNFVGRTHDEVVAFRNRWQAEIGVRPAGAATAVVPGGGPATHASFGLPDGDPHHPLPAPVLPTVRLRPRENPRG